MQHTTLRALLASILAVPACTTTIIEHDADRVVTATDCDTIFADHDTSTSTSTSTSTGTGSESSSTGGLDCPTIADGTVAFALPIAGVTRDVWFDGVAEASGVGPVVVALHGTYEGALNGAGQPNFLLYNPGVDLNAMAIAEAGVLLAPIEDPDAQADGEPFPWWPICGILGTSCTRDDDGELVELAAACALEQGLAVPDRVVVGGMSAGGLMSSVLVERSLGEITIAGATSWSGGLPPIFQPMQPASVSTSVFVLHGGTDDVYCGIGQPAGTCNGYEPHHFDAPSEQMASELAAAGSFAAVCNHGSGHNAVMGTQGAEFLAVARSDAPHPWIGFPFGVDGYGSWPQMSGGTNWMLRFYGDCHDPA